MQSNLNFTKTVKQASKVSQLMAFESQAKQMKSKKVKKWIRTDKRSFNSGSV